MYIVQKDICLLGLFLALSQPCNAMFLRFWGGEEKIEKKEMATVRLWGKEKEPLCTFERCAGEIAYVKERKKKTGEVLRNLFYLKEAAEEKLPDIALCGSGGGMRAMYMFDAAVATLEKNGFLDAVTYISTLSGSTWILGPWIASQKKSYIDFESDLLKRVQENVKTYFSTGITNILETTRKTLAKQSLTTVYSGKLGRLLFGKKETWENIRLGSLQENIASRNLPLPIFTAVIVPPNLWEQGDMYSLTRATAYWWCEMTPFEAACYDFCAAVPIDSFNSKFEDGKEVSSKREPFNLVSILGLASSAYAMAPMELGVINKTQFDQLRPISQMLGNPVYGLSACPNKIAIKEERLSIIDAGIAFNLPLPPLLHRDQTEPIDLIIIIDASGTIPESSFLTYAKQYAKAKKLRFPNIDSNDNYQTKPYALFGKPKNVEDLMFLYIPLTKNPLYKEIEKEIDDLFDGLPVKENEETEFLRDKFDEVTNYYWANPGLEYKQLLEKLDLIVASEGYKKNEYDKAIKFVEKMLTFMFKRADEGFLATTNFEYTQEQVEMLQSIPRLALTEALPTLREALEKRIKALNKKEKKKNNKEKVIQKNIK